MGRYGDYPLSVAGGADGREFFFTIREGAQSAMTADTTLTVHLR